MTDHAEQLRQVVGWMRHYGLHAAQTDKVEAAADCIEALEAESERLRGDRDHLAAWITSYHSADLLMRVREFWTPDEDGAS